MYKPFLKLYAFDTWNMQTFKIFERHWQLGIINISIFFFGTSRAKCQGSICPSYVCPSVCQALLLLAPHAFWWFTGFFLAFREGQKKDCVLKVHLPTKFFLNPNPKFFTEFLKSSGPTGKTD